MQQPFFMTLAPDGKSKKSMKSHFPNLHKKTEENKRYFKKTADIGNYIPVNDVASLRAGT